MKKEGQTFLSRFVIVKTFTSFEKKLEINFNDLATVVIVIAQNFESESFTIKIKGDKPLSANKSDLQIILHRANILGQ